MKPPRHDPKLERTVPPFPNRLQRTRTRLSAFNLRDYWWRLLDFFEASRLARIGLYAAAFGLVAGAAAWFWVYPAWQKRNSIKIAREWLAAGQLRYAAEAAQKAAAVAPESPEPWTIAAELARLGGQRDKTLQYTRRAAELSPDDPDAGIALAAAALQAGQPAEAATALAKLPAEAVAASPEAQRILGEMARRDLRLTEALAHFEAALKLDGPKAINEVPLGLVLLRSKRPPEHQRGLELLGHWTGDKDWGPAALRGLITDALEQNDRPGLLRWAEALRAHPRLTVADMPVWLGALARADEGRYADALAQLEKDHSVTPDAAAQLLVWLNEIGRSHDAVAWLKTLTAPAMQRPPLVVLAAEAFRASGAWADLQAWTARGDWGPEVNFLRWTYGLVAAKELQDEARADDLWRTLFNHAQIDTGHALFAASSLYGWGRPAEAEALWWRAGGQDGGNAIQALAALARHYQMSHDADGQYRAFRRLHLLQPHDQNIANNFAFFALLLGRDQRLAEQIVQANRETHPDNPDYLATQAFAFLQQGRANDALELLRPKSGSVATSPGIGFTYGLTLAKLGRKNEARTVLAKVPPASLTKAEEALIANVLAN